MTSGGSRARSGPAPDPNALRRDRADDKAWITLPAEGYAGDVPAYPLPKVLVFDVYFVDKERVKEFNEDATEHRWEAENDLWIELWAKPQAFMWDRLGLKFQVAAYVRTYLESVSGGAAATLKTAALRMEAELGLSTVGMGHLRWKFGSDELAERRDETDEPARSSARDRMKALNA
jgi:hypothetical protein